MVGIVPIIQTRGILAVALWKIPWRTATISVLSGNRVTIILMMTGKGSNPLPLLVRRMTSNFYFLQIFTANSVRSNFRGRARFLSPCQIFK